MSDSSETGCSSARRRVRRALFRRILSFIAPVKLHVVVALLVLALFNLAEVVTVRLLGKPVDRIVEAARAQEGERPLQSISVFWDWLTAPTGSGATLREALLALLIARLALSVLAYLRSMSSAWQNMSMAFHMRAQVYDRLQRVGFAFHDEHTSGQLINRALSDLQSVRNFVNLGLFSSVDLVFAVALYFGMLLSISPGLSLAMLLPIGPWLWLLRRFQQRSRPIYEAQMAAGDEVARVLTENVAGVHVVRAFATEEQEQEKFRGAVQTLQRHVFANIDLHQRMGPQMRAVYAAAHIGIFCLGAVFVLDGGLKVGDLVVFGMALGVVLGKLHHVNAIVDSYQQALVSCARLFEILDAPDTTPEHPAAEPLRPGGGKVEFSNVTFGYDPGKPVLRELSFTAPAGATVAIVGPTGSGKTTLAALLGRFYDPDLGSVKLDGQEAREVTLRSVRDSVGYVFQENYLFSDTIRNNIAYSELNAPMEKVREAARIARADEFIEKLPLKYENLIGEYGAMLSGGQRQRLAIARALLHNPRILVLDDALSAVDPETESEIREQLERLMKGRTTFLITSRISTARRADRILVLQNGRITQSGTHAELMKQPGYYREVAASQFAEAAPSEGLLASHLGRMARLGRRSAGAEQVEDE